MKYFLFFINFIYGHINGETNPPIKGKEPFSGDGWDNSQQQYQKSSNDALNRIGGKHVRKGAVKDHHGRCLELGTRIRTTYCTSHPSQQWTFDVDGTIRAFDKCLVGTTYAEIHDCNGTENQKWEWSPNSTMSTIKNVINKKCLKGSYFNSRVRLLYCDQTRTQIWTLP